MTLFEQINMGKDEIESIPEFIAFWYRVFVGLCLCIPILYIAGFLTGALMIKNPHLSGLACVNGMF